MLRSRATTGSRLVLVATLFGSSLACTATVSQDDHTPTQTAGAGGSGTGTGGAGGGSAPVSPSAGMTSAGTSGAAGTTTSAPPGVGSKCMTKCPYDLVCDPSEWKGLCTRDCSVDADCGGTGVPGVCAAGRCYRQCTPGTDDCQRLRFTCVGTPGHTYCTSLTSGGSGGASSGAGASSGGAVSSSGAGGTAGGGGVDLSGGAAG